MDHGHSHSGAKNLKVALLLNLTFTGIEIAGGLWTNSIAILTDAVHDSGDCVSLGFAWYLHKLSSRSATVHYTYGYRRFSVLGALTTGLLLLTGISFVLFHAVGRFQQTEAVLAPGMLVIAVLGMLINGAAVMRVHKGRSLTEQMVSWHLLEDALGWLAVLIGATIMIFTGWVIIDPILSILISIVVLYNVGRNLRKVLHVFLQRSPPGFDVAAFEDKLRAHPRVRDVHHTHVWTLDGEHHVLTTHVLMERTANRDQMVEVKETIRERLARSEFEHVTVDIELEGESCTSCVANEPGNVQTNVSGQR